MRVLSSFTNGKQRNALVRGRTIKANGDNRAWALFQTVPLPPSHPKVLSTVWKPTAVALSLSTVHPRTCFSRHAERDSGLRPYIGFQTVLLTPAQPTVLSTVWNRAIARLSPAGNNSLDGIPVTGPGEHGQSASGIAPSLIALLTGFALPIPSSGLRNSDPIMNRRLACLTHTRRQGEGFIT
jgi:hypothetical protein